MTLLETIGQLESFDNEATICATKPWTENSQSIVVLDPDARQIPVEAQNLDMAYFLDVFIAREFLEDWKANLGAEPTTREKCARLIQYAINDA